jgi:hypothetical protein
MVHKDEYEKGKTQKIVIKINILLTHKEDECLIRETELKTRRPV